MRHNLPLEIVPKNSSTEINKVAADDKDAMFDEILRLKEQLAQISETTIKEEDNDHEGKAKFGGRKLHGRYPAFQEDCVAQKAFWVSSQCYQRTSVLWRGDNLAIHNLFKIPNGLYV